MLLGVMDKALTTHGYGKGFRPVFFFFGAIMLSFASRRIRESIESDAAAFTSRVITR